MNRRGFLGAFVAFACSPAFPAPLSHSGWNTTISGLQALVADGPVVLGIERATYKWWRANNEALPYTASEANEAMEKAWQECIR